MIFFIRISDNVVGSVSYCLHNTIFFGFNHDANIKVISDIVTGKWSISISTNRDRLILIYNPNNQYITLNFIESHFIK